MKLVKNEQFENPLSKKGSNFLVNHIIFSKEFSICKKHFIFQKTEDRISGFPTFVRLYGKHFQKVNKR